MATYSNFKEFFVGITEHDQPHNWQQELGEVAIGNRLIRIPTGFGKTQGVLAAWLWHRVIKQDNNWPRRLVWCLPMRVLVEQTYHECREILERAGILWNGNTSHEGKIGVHLLMGGADSGEWHLYPEECSVLIGTQDMLLSRAMNRGYGSPRARWPMEFGLLNQDALWVMDEVQLMDVGLATSGQLQAFRDDDGQAGKSMRPCYTWWMSATVQSSWLEKSPETKSKEQPQIKIHENNRTGHLWDDVAKPCEVVDKIKKSAEFARMVMNEHVSGGNGKDGPTLVVVNRVETAVELYENLQKLLMKAGRGQTDLRLVHSRFRPHERKAWREDFLNRSACAPGIDRIIVSTQVVEAGVDISATLLITELAPWASLVQRFGRSARWGGTARVLIVDLAAAQAQEDLRTALSKAKKDSKKKVDEEAIIDRAEEKVALPYSLDEIRASRDALAKLSDVSPLALEKFEEENPHLLPRLYSYEPHHLLMRNEMEELFDTTPDLTGADIDISRFIRSGEERDLQIFWAGVPEKNPDPKLRPAREALCSVPFLKAREWLCGKETKTQKAPKLEAGKRAWVWDWLDGTWRLAERRDLYPGQTVLVAVECGGYNPQRGWSPKSNNVAIPLVSPPSLAPDEQADAAQDDESLSIQTAWQTIATHGNETARLARFISMSLAPALTNVFGIGGRCHDAGKIFPAFRGSLKHINGCPDRPDLAKAPKQAWLTGKHLYPMPGGGHRPGFRHELVSVLALFAVLQRYDPGHAALLGPWQGLFAELNMPLVEGNDTESLPNILEKEILSLDADSFNLLAYLIGCHHGKVRLVWHASPSDQTKAGGKPRLRGLEDGDPVDEVPLHDAAGSVQSLPAFEVDLCLATAGLNPKTGPGWTERCLGLLKKHGPFTLSWLEALLRAADQRSSRLRLIDPLLKQEEKS
jgi:CRISPR-associated endonuclease/helicase Cas3